MLTISNLAYRFPYARLLKVTVDRFFLFAAAVNMSLLCQPLGEKSPAHFLACGASLSVQGFIRSASLVWLSSFAVMQQYTLTLYFLCNRGGCRFFIFLSLESAMLHGALEVEKSTLPELFLLPEGGKYLRFGSSEHHPKTYGTLFLFLLPIPSSHTYQRAKEEKSVNR